MKIFNFLKTHFSGIIFTNVDDFRLNSDNNKEIWSFELCWPLLAFIGLLAFMALDDFFKQKLAFVSNDQMSKLITKQDSAIWITVYKGAS